MKKTKIKKETIKPYRLGFRKPKVSLVSSNEFETDYYYRDQEMFRTN